MKNIILLVVSLFVVSLFGCSDNPVNPVNLNSRENNLSKYPPIGVSVIQEWGWCDTSGCYGLSEIIFSQTVNLNLSIEYVFNFETLDSIIFMPPDSILYPLNRFIIPPLPNYPYHVIVNNKEYLINGFEPIPIDLYCNTQYFIRIYQ